MGLRRSHRFPVISGAESFGGAGSGFGGFFLAVPGRGTGFERAQQTIRDAGHFLDGCEKYVLVGLGGFVKAGDFSYELQRSRSDFFFRDRRIEVEQGFDIPAHACDLNDSKIPTIIKATIQKLSSAL
jgi:hypothetical protein